MFGIGWGEIALILVVAVLVIPPKDMPRLMREAGRLAGRARKIVQAARREFDDAMRVEDIKADINKDDFKK